MVLKPKADRRLNGAARTNFSLQIRWKQRSVSGRGANTETAAVTPNFLPLGAERL